MGGHTATDVFNNDSIICYPGQDRINIKLFGLLIVLHEKTTKIPVDIVKNIIFSFYIKYYYVFIRKSYRYIAWQIKIKNILHYFNEAKLNKYRTR